jgi:hypothetical protein
LANSLLSHYKLIQKFNNTYVFENVPINKHFDFSNIEKSKFIYTNKLFF